MMHRHQWQTGSKREAFRKIDPHQQCADQPWRIGYGNPIQRLQRHAGLRQCPTSHAGDSLRMHAGSNLRHYAAKANMLLHLGRDDIGKHLSSILHHGGGRFIAGGFNR